LLAISVILSLHKRVGNFFAAIDRADKDEEGASHDNKTKGSGRLVAFVVCEYDVSCGSTERGM
jgi:hypothetical protein